MGVFLTGAALNLPLSPFPLPQQEVVVERPLQKGWVLYRVKRGDTLAGIAARYGVDLRAIMWSSGLSSERLQVGQEIRIPLTAYGERPPRIPPGVLAHTVRPGETLGLLSSRYGVSLLDLVSANPDLESLNRLAEGSTVYIPKERKGLLVELAKGQTLVELALRFGLSPLEVARANGVKDPLELKPGDLVLLPGIRAKTTYERLLAKQEEERKAHLEALKRKQQERLLAQVQRQKAVVRRVSYRERGMRWPLSGFRITTHFGQRGVFQRFHTGIDLAAPYGTPIYAAKSGQVEVAGWSRVGYGLHVLLDHGGGVETLYAHLSRILVRPGAWVEAGGLIGYVGSTGWSTGPHLHFEVRVQGRPKNPLAYLP